MAEILPPEAAPGRALAIPAMARAGAGGEMLGRLQALTRQPAVARALPLLGLLAMLGIAFAAWMTFAAGPQRDLFAGMGDTDKAAVADALKASGIKYTLDRDSGALTVSDSDFYRAKMMLAQAGLPKSAPDGDAMVASLPLGASRAVEGERLRSARESDLARTIEAIDAVQAARVHLALDSPSVFLRDSNQAAASVMLTMRSGRTLTESQVRAISHLVASSVPGLAPENVSIVDQSGRLLSKAGDPSSEAADSQIEIQQRIEQRYQDALDKLLIPLVGAGNYTAQVHADLDFAETQATRESYPKDQAAVRAEQGGWTKDGGPDGPNAVGGIPGALSNTPPPAGQVSNTPPAPLVPPAAGAAAPGATAAAPAPRTNESYTRSYELGHEVSVTKNPIGTVKRLSVAVALKDSTGKAKLNPQQIAQLDGLVKGAVGFDAARGDSVALTARAFAPDLPVTAVPLLEKPWVPLLARNLSALAIAALLVFGIARPFLKRRAAAAPADAAAQAQERAAVGAQIASALADQARADPAKPITLEMIEAAPGYAARADLIRNFVRQDPARAALVVRDLIRADSAEPAGAPAGG